MTTEFIPQTRNEQHNLRLFRALRQVAARLQLKGYTTDIDFWFNHRSDRDSGIYVQARVRYISPDLDLDDYANWESVNLSYALTDPGFSADEFAASFEGFITSVIEPIPPASEAAIGNIMKLVEKLQVQAEAAGLPPLILNPIAAMAETLRTNIITYKG